MKRVLLAVLAAVVLCLPASSAASHDAWPLHLGSSGPRVAGLQWMLGGHRPNVFTKVKPTFPYAPTGYFGARTAAAVTAYKYRIGYPKAGECGQFRTLLLPVAGRYFNALLRGWKQRPVCWVALAASRIKLAASGYTELGLRIRTLEVSQLGVTESPYGCNCGARISYPINGVPSYQSSTGAYRAAWCVSFTQWAFNRAGYGYFANRSAGVFYVVDWARYHGLLNAKAKVGAIAAFLDRGGHMGTVVKVTASGYVTIEGNASNRVLERFHVWGDRSVVFIYLPRVVQ